MTKHTKLLWILPLSAFLISAIIVSFAISVKLDREASGPKKFDVSNILIYEYTETDHDAKGRISEKKYVAIRRDIIKHKSEIIYSKDYRDIQTIKYVYYEGHSSPMQSFETTDYRLTHFEIKKIIKEYLFKQEVEINYQ